MANVARLGVVIALLALLASCRDSEISALKSMDEAKIRYPGVTEIVYNERPAERTLSGPTQAYLLWVFGAHADPATIERWYGQELASRDWKPGAFPHSSATQYDLFVRTWENEDGRILRLAFYQTEGHFAVHQDLLDEHGAVFDVRLFYE